MALLLHEYSSAASHTARSGPNESAVLAAVLGAGIGNDAGGGSWLRVGGTGPGERRPAVAVCGKQAAGGGGGHRHLCQAAATCHGCGPTRAELCCRSRRALSGG